MYIRSFIACFVGLFILGCQENNRLHVEPMNQGEGINILHLDTLLFRAADTTAASLFAKLNQNDMQLLQVYVEEIMKVSALDDPYMWDKLQGFLTDQYWNALQSDIDSIFYPFDKYQESFSSALNYYQYHFPTEEAPIIFTYNSGYNFGVFPLENAIGVGLEWYVGPENKTVKQLPYDMFPNYVKQNMQPKYMAVEAIKGWLQVKNFEDRLLNANFLENMIYYGKVMYLLDACFPYETDAIKMGYETDDITWVNANAENIWAYVVQENMLFDKTKKRINQWFLDAPFTAGLPQESPAKVGVWLGWQMVKQYMQKHEEVPVEELMQVQTEDILKNFKSKKI
jgi:hypothetical protein